MKMLITAGPTREPIDPVRFLSNRSSGKMGYAIARAAIAAGHEVTLISGPVAIDPPMGLSPVRVTTSDEMFEAVHSWVWWADLCVLCAAVADFKPAHIASQKIKKSGADTLRIDLVPTRDILLSLSQLRGESGPEKFALVGFAAETEKVLEHARAKLRAKGCDLLVANDVSQKWVGFESDENALTLLFANGEIRDLPRASKDELARALVKIFAELRK